MISIWFCLNFNMVSGQDCQLSMRRLYSWMIFEEASTMISSLEQFSLILLRHLIAISHAILLEKLTIYGIKDGELEWFKDYLFSRKEVVAFNRCLLNEQDLLTGVLQGSILGPLLFLISFNDTVEVVEHSSILKHADDTVLFVAGKEIDSIEEKLSKDMDNLSKWLRCNELILDLKKGKMESILFGTTQ